MRNIIKVVFLACSIFSLLSNSLPSYAVAYQHFYIIGYDNPAALNKVKDLQLIMGGTTVFPNFHWSGCDGPICGTASSHSRYLLPYGRIAKRLTPKIVLGADYVSFAQTRIHFPADSVIRFSVIDLVVEDDDFSPRISYAINQKLAVGAGININRLNNIEVNFAVPPFGQLTNRYYSTALGWNAGVNYALTKTATLNLSYYSKIIHHGKGTSIWGPFTTRLKGNGPIPAVSTINLVKIFTPKFLMTATARYIQWGVFSNYVLQNTALGSTIAIPVKYYNSWYWLLLGRYQLNEKWALSSAVVYETSPQSTPPRVIAFPTDKEWAGFAGVEYEITKQLSTKFVVGHAFSFANIHRPSVVSGQAVGHNNLFGNIFDLSFTLNL